MKRVACFAYALACYAAFFAVYAYFAGFVGNLAVPKSIDAPAATTPAAAAVAINLALMALFALQHSVMARPGFKNIWTRLVPAPIERSTYVLASSVVLGLVMWLWQPVEGTVWHVEGEIGRAVLWALFGLGWLMVPAVSMLISHWDLFGLRQAWLHWLGRDYEPLPFHTPGLYRVVRHPLYIGWAIAFWATPTMSVGHALLAVVLTGYMVVATVFEERDLVEAYGRHYLDYQARVPRFVPRLIGARPASAAQQVRDARYEDAVR